MKILQIVQTLELSTGGVARTVLATSREMIAQGEEAEIVSLDEPDARWVREAGLKVHALGRGAGVYGYSTRLLPWLRERGGAFDCAIVNGLWQYHGFAAWRAFAGTRTPYFVFPHGMLDPWFKRTFPLKHLKKWFYWPWAEYRVLRDAAAVIFTSEEERLQARESFWLYRCNERVCPLGVESAAASPPRDASPLLERFPALAGKRIVLFLGRVHPKKGCDLLLEAFAQVARRDPALALVFAGPDQIGWGKELQERAQSLKCGDRVIFTGMIEGELKRDALERAEVFALPSHQENFGLAVVEALGAGTPVLLSNQINIWREIAADEAGLVEHDDLAGTTRLLERWCALSAEARAAMREKAAACFAKRFEIGHAVRSLRDLLRSEMAGKNSR